MIFGRKTWVYVRYLQKYFQGYSQRTKNSPSSKNPSITTNTTILDDTSVVLRGGADSFKDKNLIQEKRAAGAKYLILTRLFFPVYWGQPRLWPSHNIFLHLHLSQASSLQSPFSLISSLNTSLHLFLGLLFTPLPSTCGVSILFNQHNSSLLST